MQLIHSHFESCHGKDMSDPECGRYKYLMQMAELRGFVIKSAKEAHDFLQDHYLTLKSFEQKHARGILFRVFFYTDAKDIRPLASLADVETVKNADGTPLDIFLGITIRCDTDLIVGRERSYRSLPFLLWGSVCIFELHKCSFCCMPQLSSVQIRDVQC